MGVKRPEREADHSPPSSTEIKNVWSYTFTPEYAFMAWCLVKHKDSFTFTFTSLVAVRHALGFFMRIAGELLVMNMKFA
jgi:hypothetical protein